MEIPDPPNSSAQKQAILEYWTLVEFFSPYLLENVLDSKKIYQKIYAEEPSNTPPHPLPWLNAEVIPEKDPRTPYARGYQIYLGLFSIEETADRARHVFAKQASESQSVNWKDCGEMNSISAFARLSVSTHGIPLFGTLTLSTLPWAHGALLNQNGDSLKVEEYWKSVNRLVIDLQERFALPKKLMKRESLEAGYLDLKSLHQLADLLFKWAGYRPSGYPLVLIEPSEGDPAIAAKESHLTSGRSVPILNSFYIHDLESAAISLPTQKGMPIDLYLNKTQDKRISIESKEGEGEIVRAIRPEKTPSGRWPAPISQKQSLMQQFAINAGFDLLKEKGIFSVNGPPGTGKTSLLREMIAENIVLRANALSKFKSAQNAFVGKQAISFEGFDSILLSELDPSLTGYEMVIASSNNSAVQNISKELPLRSELDAPFHHASYLEPVAQKVFGAKKGEVWGLISAPLGNKDNCRNFVEKVFIEPSESKGHLRIWEWIDEYGGPTFLEAKEAFIKIKNEQEKLFEELEMLAFLHEEVSSEIAESYCSSELKALDEFQEASEKMEGALSRLLLEEGEEKELLALLEAQERLLKKERPGPLARMVDRTASKEWNMKLSSIRAERIKGIERLHKCKMNLMELKGQWAQHNDQECAVVGDFLDRAVFYYLLFDQYEALKTKHPASLPNSSLGLNQTEAYYQTSSSCQVRSELFVAALALHEAWLAEVLLAKGGFRTNLAAISQILQGKTPTTTDDTRLVWQSLFLLIPVISSTFASIYRFFRYVEPASLGWIFIDEAGQASPQSAVGAILRAKRVFAIGDPFQIEPICQVPEEVIDGMAKIRIQDNSLDWAPSQISVQQVIDRISVFGSERTLRDVSYWVSSPLRVHRRCLEPMFTISNLIAYESSMHNATLNCGELSLPGSCWWDVGGNVSKKHYVSDHGDALLHLLKEMLKKMKSPDFYIISPFKEVIGQVQNLLSKDAELCHLFKDKFQAIPFSAWIRESIGTVHTFQGKQALAVFFVLGGDKSTSTAIEWASRKPNLLNVAVTRAKGRFYMIGDYDLWKTRPYFDVAAKKLERRKVFQKCPL
jgi:hypothetical protein